MRCDNITHIKQATKRMKIKNCTEEGNPKEENHKIVILNFNWSKLNWSGSKQPHRVCVW